MNSRFAISLLCWFLTCLCLSLPAQSAQRAAPEGVDRIVAVVDSEVITYQELHNRLATAERQLRQQNVPLPDTSVLEKQLLDRLVMERVQLLYAKESGLVTSDADLDGALQRIAQNNKMTLPAFRAALEKDGINWARFREEIRDQITLTRLREREVNSRVFVSDGEIDNYLKNPEEGAADGTTEVSLAHIVLRVPENPTQTQLMSIGARAQTALDQIRRGEDFAKVAASYSESPDALSGGVIEARPLDRLPPIYAEAVKRLQVGEVSEILRSSVGFHIVKLISKRSTSTNPLAEDVTQTHARHILIKVNDQVSDADAQHKMLSIKERLDNGASFAEMARLYSDDLSSSKGGDLGWLYPGDTVPEFEKAMDALQPNQISAPVKSPFGYHIIQVLERRTGSVSPERQRLIARQVLRERKSDEVYQEWLRQLRDRAYVEYRLEED
jgi:peptidyl-prolyl cis-trans isomerase SurA